MSVWLQCPAQPVWTDFGANFNGCCLAGSWLFDRSRRSVSKMKQNWMPSPLLSSSIKGIINFSELVAVCIAVLMWALKANT